LWNIGSLGAEPKIQVFEKEVLRRAEIRNAYKVLAEYPLRDAHLEDRR
jgi:hypothetical protein